MTLLELLFNFSLPTLLLPNNEGQPGTFPMPAFREYLVDWSFYLRTHMPYVDDLYQPTIRKYLVVEAAFIYFYLIAALRRFRIAQYYLLIKLTTFALLFLTSGFSYLNILAWILCFVVYPLELIVMYWFGHLLAWYRDLYLRTIYGFDPVTDVEGGYIGKEHYESEEEYDAAIKKRDHDVAEMKRLGGKWRLGLRGDLHTYFVLFIFSYAYAKFKMILGNPLATLYKLDLFDDIATIEEECNSGLVYEEDGDFIYISNVTLPRAARRYERVAHKHPLISVLKERAEYADFLDAKYAYKEDTDSVDRLPESRAKLFNYPYSYLFGKELPWLTQEEAALAANAERWLSESIDAPARSWNPILDPFKEKISAGTTPARSFYHWNKDMVTAKGARAFFRKLRDSWYRFTESAEHAKESPNFGDRTLAQRIIDTCSTNQFAAERAAVLTSTNKRYTILNSTAHTDATLGYFAPARWRYSTSRVGAHSAFNEALVPGNERMAWHDYYNHTFGTDAGWSRANRSHPYFRPFCVEPFWHEQSRDLTLWSPRTSPMRPHTHVELQVGKPARPGAKPLERAKWEHPLHARPAWELSQEDHSLLNQRSYEALLREETIPTPVEYPTVKPAVWDKKRKGPSWLESYIQKKLHPRPIYDHSRRSETPVFNTHDLSPTPPPPGSSFWRNRAGSASTSNRFGFSTFNFEQFAPLMELDSISNLRYGLLFILALSSLTVYSIILAGWSSNSKYAFLGALRSAAQMISYEVSISLALLPVILLAGSLNLTAIVCGQTETVWYLFPLLPIALIFLVSMLAETNRTPFDLPEAEAELVAGYNVDYSSLPFAMFFLGEYSNMILISVLFCLLFLGGWDGAFLTLQEPYTLTFKAAFVWVFFVIVRATLPRYRYDQLMDIGWKAFLPFAGSFLVLTFGLVIFLDVAPVVEEVALEDLYGVPALPPTAAACLVGAHSHQFLPLLPRPPQSFTR